MSVGGGGEVRKKLVEPRAVAESSNQPKILTIYLPKGG